MTITDDLGCFIDTCLVILEPTPLITSTTNQIDVSCTGGSDGCITIVALGATPGYTFSLGSLPTQTNPTFYNFQTGSYSVTVSDTNGCSTIQQNIIEPASLPTQLVWSVIIMVKISVVMVNVMVVQRLWLPVEHLHIDIIGQTQVDRLQLLPLVW